MGKEAKIAVDANQIWSVPEAIKWMEQLAEFDIHWIEEPTSPDDILGHLEISRALQKYGMKNIHTNIYTKKIELEIMMRSML